MSKLKWLCFQKSRLITPKNLRKFKWSLVQGGNNDQKMAYVISSLRKSQHQSQTDWLSFSHVLLNCWDAFVACCMPSAMIPFIIVMIIFRDLWWPPHFSVWPLLAAFSMGWHLAKPLISFTPLALTLVNQRLHSSWEFREVESIWLLCCLQQDLSFIFYPFNN